MNTYLIIGATGKQGGAVIDALLALPDSKNLTILAVTRNPESPSAKALQQKALDTIKLIKGELSNVKSIFAAVEKSIKGAFLVSIPAVGLSAADGSEEANGMAFIDAAVEHGVKHVVYTSVDRHGSASELSVTDVPHFIHKAHIETHLREKAKSSQLTWTILRPTAFMDNITTGFAGKIFPTAWKFRLTDIGYFGAQALLHPEKFAERSVSLAGDELTFDEANAIYQKQFGCDIPTTYGVVGSALVWAVKDINLMFKFFEEVGYAADIQALREEYPGLLCFGDWLKTRSVA